MSNGLTAAIGKSEYNQGISQKSFESTAAIYKKDFGTFQNTISAPLYLGHFQRDANYETLIGENPNLTLQKLPEISEITERFKSSNWMLNIMGKEETPYRRIVEQEERNYKNKTVNEEKDIWYDFDNLPVQKSITVMGMAEIEEFNPKLYDE